MKSKKISKIYYFFVDESGDPTFYNREGRYIVGEEGCSKILILGFIITVNPSVLRQSVLNLLKEISEDDYLREVPSFTRTLKEGFHAKNDMPEIRERFLN